MTPIMLHRRGQKGRILGAHEQMDNMYFDPFYTCTLSPESTLPFVSNLWGAESRRTSSSLSAVSLSPSSQTLVPANWQTRRGGYGRPLSAAVAIKLLEKVVWGPFDACLHLSVVASVVRPIRMQMVTHWLSGCEALMSALLYAQAESSAAAISPQMALFAF